MSASIHRNTPSLVAVDPRGLIVRNVNYHRSSAEDEPQVRIHRQVFGSTGLMIEQWDPRLLQLSRSQPDTAPNQRTVYSLGGQALRTHSVDAVWRLTLMASAAQQQEEQFARNISEAAIAAAQESGLSHEETERLVNFVYARRHAEEGITFYVSQRQGTLRGYVGPVDLSRDVARILRESRNPMPELKRMGYSAIVLRSPERESAAASSQQAGSRAFEVGVTTQVAGPSRARGGRQAQAQVPWVAPAAARAAAPQMEFDTARLVDTQLSGRERRSIALTLSHLREGRFGAVHWHAHRDQLWSADLHGYASSRGRGAYRLMFSHLGGPRYRVEGVSNPHR